MVTCPECGKDVKEAKFCSNCGALLPKAEEIVSEEVEETTIDAAFEEPSEEVEESVEAEDVEEVTEDEVEEVVEEEATEEVTEDEVEEVVEEEATEEVTEDEVEEVVEEESNEENIEEESAEDVEDAVEEEPAAEEVDVVKKTKFCSNCGTQVDMSTVFCPQCGFRLIQEEQPQTKFCQSCGKKIDINAEICPYCGVRVANIRQSSDEKNVLLAAILSFLFPGLGHLYLGLNKKGISFIVAYIVSAILVFLVIGFVLIVIVWLWALIDSIKSTESINNGEFVEDKLF